MNTPDLFSWTPPIILGDRDGQTYDAKRDRVRLNAKSKRDKYCPRPGECIAKKTGKCPCQGERVTEKFVAEYRAWTNMKTRCTNPKFSLWHRYGGRGIKVCDRWLNSFDDFLKDMGQKPLPNAILDRIDNDGNYEPDNVKWSAPIESARNKSTVQRIEVDGNNLTLPEWEQKSGRCRKIIWRRLKQGWPPALAIFADAMPYDLRTKPNAIQLYWQRWSA